MRTTEINGRPSRARRFTLIGSGIVLVIVVLVGVWFGMRQTGGTKPTLPDSLATHGAVASPTSAPSDFAATSTTDLQVELATEDLKKAQIRTARVTKAATATTLRVPGIVKPNEYRQVHVTPLVGGIVKEVRVVLGDHVRRGQPLAVIFSSELAEAQTQYLSHLAQLEADHKKLERTQTLVRLGAASKQEEEEVAAMHAAHEAEVRAALERLKLLGAGDQQIGALKGAGQINPNFTVPAPISGVVLSRSANLGLVVNTAQELFTVADLSPVWVIASVNEKDFASVRVGSAASITAPAYAGRVWKGRVTYIQPQVDPNTRTAQARIEVVNPREILRIDMYMDVEFTSESIVGPVVPEAAVQSIGERQFVFLPVKDNEGSFTLRQIRLGTQSHGHYQVLEGLKPDDIVVTDGSFILKAEAARQHPDLR
ncbi:MAG: efflux RND transporter periplasmic adaptor subunit [Candidatus Acidiferrales bacterium]